MLGFNGAKNGRELVELRWVGFGMSAWQKNTSFIQGVMGEVKYVFLGTKRILTLNDPAYYHFHLTMKAQRSSQKL